MRKTAAMEFWKHYLDMVLTGDSVRTVDNPAVDFTIRAKAGDFDEISDEDYADLLRDVEEVSALFLRAPKANPLSVFNRALHLTPLTRLEREKIQGILAHASERVDYRRSEEQEDLEVFIPSSSDNTPAAIYEYLCHHIYGHDDARKSAAMIMYNHLNNRRRNALFMGPTGCGKSEIWRTLSRKYPFIKIFDATMLSADGWKGSLHWRGVFESVPEHMRSSMVIVFDEADKMFEPAYSSGGTDVSYMIQNTLLRVMDGDTMSFEGDDKHPPMTVDCSGISVILLGAFESLFSKKSGTERSGLGFGASVTGNVSFNYDNTEVDLEDVITYGHVRKEIAGRIHSVTILETMTEDDFMKLLDVPDISPIYKLAKEYGISITVSDSLKHELASEAHDRSLGVRFIRSRLQDMIDRKLFSDPRMKKCFLGFPEKSKPAQAFASAGN